MSAPLQGTGALTDGQGPRFPAPVYRDTVLAQVFADAQKHFLDPLIEIEYAHTLMLARQAILPAPEAAQCLQALSALDREALRRREYDGSFEDLFFLLEHELAELCGIEIAGKMHTARSRNDIDLTLYRMVLRDLLLDLLAAQLTLAKQLAGLAWTHRASLMPAYTHNQPAQPSTLGHYLMALVEVLERDAERAIAAFGRVNRSPLGACAITTTGFAIDRSLTARLLGFKGLAVNSYGAIVAVDYLLESASVLATGMVSLGRFAQDLLLWSTAEFNFLRLSDAYVQISSIMPQKRNPVPLEHVRVLASRALFQAQGVAGCLHNTPFADMNDAEDDLQPLVYTAFADGIRSLTLLAGALGEAEFNTGRMAAAADSNFLTVTELADTLVRTCGISFHSAHHLVSTAVKELNGAGLGFDRDRMAAIILRDLPPEHYGVRPITRQQILKSLHARNFIDVRSLPGGPALSSLEPEIAAAQQGIARQQTWLAETRASLRAAHAELYREARELVREAGVRPEGAGAGQTAKPQAERP